MKLEKVIMDTPTTDSNRFYSGQFMVSKLDDDGNNSSDVSNDVTNDMAEDNTSDLMVHDNKHKRHTSHNHQLIDSSLTPLFQCLSVVYPGKITNPKWNHFHGINFTCKDKIRLNNIIWREYHMQFIGKISAKVIVFADPLSENHTKPEVTLLEGKYWKRRVDSIRAQYSQWRNNKHNNKNASPLETIPSVLINSNDGAFDLDMDLDLFLDQEFSFPDLRDISQLGNADIIQPGLHQLQPRIDQDFSQELSFLSTSSFGCLDRLFEETPSEVAADLDLDLDIITPQPFNVPLDPPESVPMQPSIPPRAFVGNQFNARPQFSQTTNERPQLLAALLQSPSPTVSQYNPNPFPPNPPPPPSHKKEYKLRNNSNTFILKYRCQSPPNPFSQIKEPGQFYTQSHNDYQMHQNFTSQPTNQIYNSPSSNPSTSSLVALLTNKTSPMQCISHSSTERSQFQSGNSASQHQEYSPINNTCAIEECSFNSSLNQWPTYDMPMQENQLMNPPDICYATSSASQYTSSYQPPEHQSPFISSSFSLADILSQKPHPKRRSLDFILPETTNQGPLSSFSKRRASQPNIQTQQYPQLTASHNTLYQQPSASCDSYYPTLTPAISTYQPIQSHHRTSSKSSPLLNTVKCRKTSPGEMSSSLPAYFRNIRGSADASLQSTSSAAQSENLSKSTESDVDCHQLMAMITRVLTNKDKTKESSQSVVPERQIKSKKRTKKGLINNRTPAISDSEAKRRHSIKHSIETLQALLPSQTFSTPSHDSSYCPKTAATASVLLRAAQRIRSLREEQEKSEAEEKKLRDEFEELQSNISSSCSRLPCNGVGVDTSALHQTPTFYFTNYVRQATRENWKFYIFSLIIDDLFGSFNAEVSCNTPALFKKNAFSWLHEHTSLVQLRLRIMQAMRTLGSTTSILTNPEKLPTEALSAVLRKDVSYRL